MKRRNKIGIVCGGIGAMALAAGILFLRGPSSPVGIPEPLSGGFSEADSPSFRENGATVADVSDGATRGPAAARVTKKSRAVSSRTFEDAMDRLSRGSANRWQTTRNRDGFVTRMTGAAYGTGQRAPVAASQSFLREFARDLLGVGIDDLAHLDVRQEGEIAQVLYRQQIDGLPVFGSGVNLFFDRGGNLVHLVSNVYAGSSEARESPVSPEAAATSAREAVLETIPGSESFGPDVYPLRTFVASGELGYWYIGKKISLIYKYNISLIDEHGGDIEVLVDASSAAVVELRRLSRN
jgi:hypothetical protein